MSNYVVPLNSDEAADAARFGPKAANQAQLGRIGLPIPDGFCLSADAYRRQLEHLGLTEAAQNAVTLEFDQARPFLSRVRVAIHAEPIAPDIADELLSAYRDLAARNGPMVAVRSSSLMEDTEGSSFAGQFQTYLGIDNETDFLTTVRGCWGALWSGRALRYMTGKAITPQDTAMAVLVQPLVQAVASGGGLSRTADGGMSVSATWGLGEALAQGEVVPDRYHLTVEGELIEAVAGRKAHSIHCAHHHAGPSAHKVEKDKAARACLGEAQVRELAGYMRRAEQMMGRPVEVEWAMDEAGIKMLQARPLHVEEAVMPDEVFSGKPGLRGHPGGVGWGAGRAVVVNCECEIGRVAPGDVLVTKVAGPALAHILPRVAGVVAELGGSTSHLASLARERGVPMVLGVDGATARIPDGAQVGVDGVAGVVRWIVPDPRAAE